LNDTQDTARLDPIGFVGLGHMGGNMAARFLDAGYPVCGTARSRERGGWLVDRGLGWLETPREIAEAASFVLTSLPDDDAVDAVAGGADGLLAGLGAGEIWADLSTISPGVSRDLSARVAERRAEMVPRAPISAGSSNLGSSVKTTTASAGPGSTCAKASCVARGGASSRPARTRRHRIWRTILDNSMTASRPRVCRRLQGPVKELAGP
jgi:3-hydroxyisobutyrate dehydrogenase-like beta-hydroxyacid dehydrogenase